MTNTLRLTNYTIGLMHPWTQLANNMLSLDGKRVRKGATRRSNWTYLPRGLR